MNRRQLVLAGGTIAWAVHRTVRRNRRRPRRSSVPPELRAVVAVPALWVTLAGPMSEWSPSWVFNEFFGWFGVFIDPIKDFVLNVASWVGNRVVDLLNIVEWAWNQSWEALTATVNQVADASLTALRAVGGVITDTYAMLDDAFRNFREQAKAMLESAFNNIKDIILDEIPDILSGLLGDAWDILQMLIDIGAGGIALLADFVRDPIGFIWDLISGLVSEAIEAAQEIGQFGFDAIWALFWTTLQTVLGIPEDPLDVLKGAWWLLQVAYYITTGNIEKIAKDFLPDAVDYFEREIRRLIGEEQFKIEEWVGMAQGPANGN